MVTFITVCILSKFVCTTCFHVSFGWNLEGSWHSSAFALVLQDGFCAICHWKKSCACQTTGFLEKKNYVILECYSKILVLKCLWNFQRICVFGKNLTCYAPRAELKTSTGKFTSYLSQSALLFMHKTIGYLENFFSYSKSFLIRLFKSLNYKLMCRLSVSVFVWCNFKCIYIYLDKYCYIVIYIYLDKYKYI